MPGREPGQAPAHPRARHGALASTRGPAEGPLRPGSGAFAHFLRCMLALLALAAAGGATAQADDSLYRELGGREAIVRFTDDFYDRMLADARIARHFDGINTRYLKDQLAIYFCVTAGGPCRYDGVSMHDAHAHLGLRKADFNALVEDLQLAMDAAGLPFAVQNRLLARLAFFHRDIVNR